MLTRRQKELLFQAFIVANRGLGTADKWLQEAFATLLLPPVDQRAKIRSWLAAARLEREGTVATADADTAALKTRLSGEITEIQELEVIT